MGINFEYLKKDGWIIASIGVLEGFTLWMVHEIWPESPELQTWFFAGATLVIVAGLVTQFAWTGKDQIRLVAVAATVGFSFALCSFWVFGEIAVKDVPYKGGDVRFVSWIMAVGVALFVLEPFIQIFQRTGTLRYPYQQLFFHSWGNFPIVALGYIYIFVFWGLTLLWGGLFKIINIEFFWTVFTSPEFKLFSSPVLFAIGLANGRENSRIINTTRGTILSVFRFLMPLLALIALLFLMALPFKGLDLLWSTDMATPLLLTLISLLILFLNGTFEDGEKEPPFHPFLRFGVEAATLAMPIFSGIAFYSLNLRIDQYGLTPYRFFAMVLVIITGCYALGYAVAVIRRRGVWMGFIRPVNLTLAWVVIAITLALHTPILDPIGWSARNQFQRLMKEKVDPEMFDYGFLRFKLGRQGWETLQRMEGLNKHPNFEKIQAGLENAREMKYYQRPKLVEKVPPLKDEHFVLLGGLDRIPEGFLSFLETSSSSNWRKICQETPVRCYLFPVELDGTGPPEVCLRDNHKYFKGFTCFRHLKSVWEKLGILQTKDERRFTKTDLEFLRENQVKTVPHKYRNIQIGETMYFLLPEN